MNAPSSSSAPKTALITGASGGIGKDLAELFAKDGHHVVRSKGKLEELAATLTREHGITARVITADLGVAGAAERLVQTLDAQGIAVDVLVNNAGFGSFGAFAEADVGRTLEMIQLNVTTLVHLTRLLVPGMVSRGHGRVLNVASTAAFQPGPLMAVYYATKAFVLSFSEAIGNELSGTGVTVTALCPGPTETGFQAGAQLERSALLKRLRPMDSKAVARAGYRAMWKGKAVEVPGAQNRAALFAVRVLPRTAVTAMVRKMQEPVAGAGAGARTVASAGGSAEPAAAKKKAAPTRTAAS
mgnify:CR=1 FL=1